MEASPDEHGHLHKSKTERPHHCCHLSREAPVAQEEAHPLHTGLKAKRCRYTRNTPIYNIYDYNWNEPYRQGG